MTDTVEDVVETVNTKAPKKEPKADLEISSADFEQAETQLPPKRNKKMPPKLKDKSNSFNVADDVVEDTKIMADGRVRAFNKDGSKVHTAIDENGDIYQMTFNKDGTTTATRIRDGKVRTLPSGTVKEGYINKSMGKNERLVSENLEKYGHMDKSTAIPKKTEFGETSEAFETMLTGGRLDDHAKELLNIYNSYEGTGQKVDKITLNELADNARSEVSEYNGDVDKLFERYKGLVDTETLKDIPKVNAFEVALIEEAIKRGRYDLLDDITSTSVVRRGLVGQGHSSSRLFNSQTPTGKVMTIQKVAKKMSKEYGVEVKISDEQLKRLAEATDEFELDKIKNEIHVEMWNQVPPTMYDKLTAWRYTCMLANPRTHIRNITGNGIMLPLRTIRNVIAHGLETMLVKEDGIRSKAMLTVDDNPLLELAKESYKKNHHSLSEAQKFNDLRRPQEARVFKNKALEKIRLWNSKLLEKEDELAFKPLYEKSYAQFLKANGFDVDNPSKELLEMAEKYATDEALEGTYRNENVLADFLAKSKAEANLPLSKVRGNTTAEKIIHKTWAMLVDTMVPFSKTPTNEDKQKAISNIYTEARKKADKEVLLSRGIAEEEIDFNMLSKTVRDKYTGGDKKAFVNTYNGMHGYSTNAKACIVEVAFVDNKEDIKDFDEDHEKRKLAVEMAKAIAQIVGVKVDVSAPPKPTKPTTPTTPTKPSANRKISDVYNSNKALTVAEAVKAGQAISNIILGTNIPEDGIDGPQTQKNRVRMLQWAMNRDYYAGLDVDGLVGNKTLNALGQHTVRRGEIQYMVTALEVLLLMNGYNPHGVEIPGQFGSGLEKTVLQYQMARNNLANDGIAGRQTFLQLIK